MNFCLHTYLVSAVQMFAKLRFHYSKLHHFYALTIHHFLLKDITV